MANRMTAGFLRDDTTGALVVSGGGGGAATVITNISGVSSPADGAAYRLKIGSTLADRQFEDFVYSAADGKLIGDRQHNMLDTTDTWGLDLSNQTLASIRNAYRRFYCALPYGKAHTHLTAQALSGATTLTVADTSTFAAAGTLRIRGDNVTYTGKTGTTFTGVAGLTVTQPTLATIITQGEVGGWGTAVRPLDRVAEMYAAGFTLQIYISAFLNGSFDDKSMTIGAYMFHGNESESISLPPADASGGLGMGVTLTGPADDLVATRSAERPFVQKVGQWTALGVTPTKRYLWCALYGKMDDAAANDNGEAYGVQVRTRWVGTP